MSSEMPAELAAAIIDPASYADPQKINAAFARIRRDYPFAKANVEGYDPFWVASKHADVIAIETQPDIFLNGAGSNNLTEKAGVDMVKAATGENNLLRTLVTVDGEEHKALRKIGFPAFTPKALKALEADIRDIARHYIDRFLEKAPQSDFVEDIALNFPLRVVMSLLGVPVEDEPFMLRLTQEMFGASDPDLNRTKAEVTAEQRMGALKAVMAELEDYFSKVTKEARERPTEGLNSVIANARIDGEYLNHRQLMGYYIIAATAGHDTTSNTISSAMWALAERPELLAELQEHPDRIDGFVEESIRWASAVKTFMRTAVKDAEIAGQQVKAGDWILLSYHSAAQDEDVYPDPFTFDITRPRRKQIAFGTGPHVCIGQHLARMEIRVLWEELLPKLESVKLAGEPKLYKSNFVVGPKTVPIEFSVK